jgi:hypothetical protein
LRDTGDARISLDEVLAGAPAPSLPGAAGISAPLWRRALPWALFAMTAITLIALAVVHFREKIAVPTAPPQRYEIVAAAPTPSGVSVLSPDGTRLVLGGFDANRLWLRRMDSLDAHPIEGTTAHSECRSGLLTADSSRSARYRASSRKSTPKGASSGGVRFGQGRFQWILDSGWQDCLR